MNTTGNDELLKFEDQRVANSTVQPETQTDSQENPEESTRTKDQLEEGELYVMRKGHLEHIPSNDTDGMRRTRIMEDAYQLAMEIGGAMRQELQGYKPDVSLVVSALLLSHEPQRAQSKEIVRKFVIKMFSELS